MSGKWTKIDQEHVFPVAKLANLALRARRLIFAQRIKALQGMIRIHMPKLRKEPGGLAKAEELTQQLNQAMQELRGLHGRR
jgi:hypothetical protein